VEFEVSMGGLRAVVEGGGDGREGKGEGREEEGAGGR